MKIALVHDYLVQYGGAEKVLEALCEIFPEAPIYTLIYDENINSSFKGKNIKTSFLQKIPFARKHHRLFLALMPMAIERLDLSGFDLIISDSSSYAKGVKKRKGALHICYCHTPLRYAWDYTDKYIEESSYPKIVKYFLPHIINFVRRWDFKVAQRPDYFIANSKFIADKIKKYYKREAEVIYPPVEIVKSSTRPNDVSVRPDEPFGRVGRELKVKSGGNYYLIVSRLMPYKRVDLAIEAFNDMGLKLKIVGDGPDRRRLEKTAKANIEFLGSKPNNELASIYENCKAFIMPQEEDFGIAAVEAQMCGKPVIALASGGALESIIDGKTGIFFKNQTKEDLIAAVRKFNGLKFNEDEIKSHAQKFNKEEFKRKIKEFVDKKLDIK